MATELELARTPGDRRLYALGDVGRLRLTGFVTSGAVAEADGETWRFGRRGLWQRGVRATDEAGAVVGEFEPRAIRRGGAIRWAGRRGLALRPASSWRERYALVDGDRELATFHATSSGKRPVRVTIADGAVVEPGLLLFTAFVVRRLKHDADGTAAASASTTAATSG
jgi:hypothetical protein